MGREEENLRREGRKVDRQAGRQVLQRSGSERGKQVSQDQEKGEREVERR